VSCTMLQALQRPSSIGLPAVVARDLATHYSRALYGATGQQINASTVRVVWPHLLSAKAYDALHGSVACGLETKARSSRRQSGRTFLFYDTTNAFVNGAALWVHQPGACAPVAAAPSHSWVEVSHCFYYNWGEHIHPGSPMFWFVVPGSGLWMDIGESLVLDDRVYGTTQLGRVHKHLVRLPGKERTELHRALPLLLGRSLPSGTPGAPGNALDTIQFPRCSPTGWRGECLTEIVSLRFGSEMSFVTSHLNESWIACGSPPNHLRRCTLGDEAARAHGPSCARNTPSSLLDHINCSIPRRAGQREAFASRAARSLARAAALQMGVPIQQAVAALRTSIDT